MVVLADELLESFFDTDFSASFRLEPVAEAPLALSGSGLFGGLISSIVTDDNIKMFHKITDEFGKTIGQHQACTPLLSVTLLS
jgi:TBC1 domain family member 8/9